MLSYSISICDFIYFFIFAVCKIIGDVQLRSFIGNFLKTHLYNVSDPILLVPLLIYYHTYKHASFTCSALLTVLQCFIFWDCLGLWRVTFNSYIYCYNSPLLSQWDLCGEDKNFFLCLTVNQVTFMPTFLWLFKQNENVSIQVHSFSIFASLLNLDPSQRVSLK